MSLISITKSSASTKSNKEAPVQKKSKAASSAKPRFVIEATEFDGRKSVWLGVLRRPDTMWLTPEEKTLILSVPEFGGDVDRKTLSFHRISALEKETPGYAWHWLCNTTATTKKAIEADKAEAMKMVLAALAGDFEEEEVEEEEVEVVRSTKGKRLTTKAQQVEAGRSKAKATKQAAPARKTVIVL